MASRVAEFRIPPGWTRIELREKVLNFYSSVGEDDSKELAARLLMYAESRTACLLYAPPSPGSTSTLAEVLHYLCVPGAKSGLTNEVGGYAHCRVNGRLMRCFISVPTEMVAPFDASLRPHMAGDFVYIAKAVSQSTRFKHASLQSGNLQNNMNADLGVPPGSAGTGLPVTVPAQYVCPVYRSTVREPKLMAGTTIRQVFPQANINNQPNLLGQPGTIPTCQHVDQLLASFAEHAENVNGDLDWWQDVNVSRLLENLCRLDFLAAMEGNDQTDSLLCTAMHSGSASLVKWLLITAHLKYGLVCADEKPRRFLGDCLSWAVEAKCDQSLWTTLLQLLEEFLSPENIKAIVHSPTGHNGDSLLQLAIKLGNDTATNELFSFSMKWRIAIAQQKNRAGETALHTAVVCLNLPAVSLLIESAAVILLAAACNAGHSPMVLAARSTQPVGMQILKKLADCAIEWLAVERAEHPSITQRELQAALLITVEGLHSRAVEMLLSVQAQNGVKIPLSGSGALHAWAKESNQELRRAVTGSGGNKLELALKRVYATGLCLLNAGANPREVLQGNPSDGTPLAISVRAASEQLRVLSGPFEKLAEEFGRLDGAVKNWTNKTQNDGRDQFVAIGKLCAAIQLSAFMPMFMLLRTAGYDDLAGACLKEAFMGSQRNIRTEKRYAWFMLAVVVRTFENDGQSVQQDTDSAQQNGATGNLRASSSATSAAALQADSDAAAGKGIMCSVCMDNMINTSFYPCGHACTCDVCDAKLQEAAGRPHRRTCPICRTVIQESRRMILSGAN